MIALKKQWLQNLRIQEEAKAYGDKGYITHEEFDAACKKYPVGFYMPNVFVRAGLFILTFLVMLIGDGLLTLIAASGNVIESPGWPLFLGVISYACLEGVIAAKQHFRSGVDDALLSVTTILLSVAVFFVLDRSGIDEHIHNQWFAFCLFVITLYFTIRFVDTFMAAICCGSFFSTILLVWNNVGFGGLYAVPFVMILVSAGVYWLISLFSKKGEFIWYENCLLVARVISLVVFYAAGNYYVVQTLGNELNPGPSANGPLPLGAFFWSWTMLIPLIYVIFGIRRKDTSLLRVGLLLIVAAVATFRNYYHILPADIALTLAGVVAIGISWTIIRYLKTPMHGFTYDEPGKQSLLDHARVESLITAQSVANMPAGAPTSESRFGGGDFGGGGSSGSF